MTRPTIHPTNLASLWTRSFKFPFTPKLSKMDSENGLAYSFNCWVTWQIPLMLNFSTNIKQRWFVPNHIACFWVLPSPVQLVCTHQTELSEWFQKKVTTNTVTAEKMKFSIKDFFSKCDQILRDLRIWSYLLKKPLIENFIFCAVSLPVTLTVQRDSITALLVRP